MSFVDEDARKHFCKYFASSCCFEGMPGYTRDDFIRDINNGSIPPGVENESKLALPSLGNPLWANDGKITIETIDRYFERHNAFSDCKVCRGKVIGLLKESVIVKTPQDSKICKKLTKDMSLKDEVIVHGEYAFK
jgi:hypothetical protein